VSSKNKDKATSLTFKSPPPAGTDPRFKVARELEVRLDDFDTMDAILRALEFQPRQIYQKWRETWRIHQALVCMDTMPFGRFLEIEGLPDTIIRLANDLGLRWERRIRANFLGMFAALKERERLPFDDLTFDNFGSVSISFDRHWRHFEAGSDDGQ
jgi:adenylate cyclase class 2